MIQDNPSQFRAPVIKLPKIDSALAKLWAELSEREITGQVVLSGQPWEYRERSELDDGVTSGTAIELLVNDAPVTLCLVTRVIDWIEELQDFYEPYDALSPERLAMVLEHVLTSEIEALESKLGVRIELTAVRLNARFDCGKQLCALDVKGEVLGAKFAAYLDAQDRQDFARMFASGFERKQRRSLNHIKVPVKFLGPTATLSDKAVRDLRNGSVLFPSPEWRSNSPKLWYIAWGHYIAQAREEKTGVKIEGPEDNFDVLLHKHIHGDTAMQGEDGKSGGASNPSAIVTLELGRQDMSISEIEELRKGAIIDFDIEKIEEVTVFASGTAIAIGRLVQLDETVGVQITKLL